MILNLYKQKPPRTKFASDLSALFKCIEFDKERESQNFRTLGNWFRGQADTADNLIPSLYRRIEDCEQYNAYEDLKKWKVLRKEEERIISEFRTRTYHIIDNINIQSKYMLLSIMQHNGTPTRMLDFSESLTSALFFALDKYIKDPYRSVETIPCIWVLDPNHLDLLKNEISFPDADKGIKQLNELDDHRFIDKKFILSRAPFNSERIKAQQGCFLIFPNDASRGIPDCAINLHPQAHSLLTKINLTCPNKIALQMKQIGMRTSTYYPEIQTICEEIDHLFFLK